MIFRRDPIVLLGLVVALAAAPANAQRVGSPVGTLDVEVREGPNLFGVVTNVVTARIDPDDVGEDFAGVVGFSIAVRAVGPWSIASIGLPEGGAGALEPNDPPDGWYDVRVTTDAPLPVVDGRIELAEIVTFDTSDGSLWAGPTVEVLPSFRSELPGWATWRESARTGACSDTDPALRPCDRPFDRIEAPDGWPSDGLGVSVPHVVVTPGERVTIPVLGRCLSMLLWARSFDLGALDAGLVWEASQLDLAGGAFFRRAPDFTDAEGFVVDFDFIPPRPIPNTTERAWLFALTFDVPMDATGTILRVDDVRAAFDGGGAWTSAGFSGSVRVMDCTPGDVDGDERIGAADAVMVLQRRVLDLLDGEAIGASTLCTADVDRDGIVTSADARSVLRRAIGLQRTPGARPTANGIVPGVRLESRDDRILLHADGTSDLEVELAIGDAAYRRLSVIRGAGPVIAHALDGRLVVAAAHTEATERTIELDLAGDATVRIEAARATDAFGTTTRLDVDSAPVVVGSRTELFVGAQPNPFNPSTRLRYRVVEPGPVLVEVFDARGRRVRSIPHVATQRSGHVEWNGRDDDGRPVASGVYAVRLTSDHGAVTGRVTLVE